MTRGRGRRRWTSSDPEQVQKAAGVKATWSGICDVCGGEVHGAQVVRRHGRWIHTHCAPGQDDV